MSTSALGLFIFFFSLLVIELVFYAYRNIRYSERAEIRKRLKNVVMDEHVGEEGKLIKKRVLSDVLFFNRILPYLPGVVRLDQLFKQANLKYTLEFFLLLSITLALTAYLLISVLVGNPLLSVLVALISGSLPFLHVRRKKKQRMAKFEKQLPEGLELIARSLRAGHAFISGMRLAADDFGDPLGPEFEETIEEINFGVNVPDALKNLTRRIDCPDLGFFVVSVILQRETGGNLAEIIENLAHLIRERFKFRGKVKTLSAEGRFSAVVLLAIPFVLFGLLFVINRSYVTVLMADPIGHVMAGLAGFMMILGILMIKRIIKVDV